MHATEQLTFEQSLNSLPRIEGHAKLVLDRLNRIDLLPKNAMIVDVGAAQGLFAIACARMGYRAFGVEPWDVARENARALATSVGVKISIFDGTAEALPLQSNAYDIVHANSVIEHVVDARAAFAEAFRVLRPGGVFWFLTASSMCPKQSEIRGFPAFSWYPNPLKRKIMDWAKRARPELVGNTTMPAIHWFTPWKARRMLREAGFGTIYDRWDLRLPSEGGPLYRRALKIIRQNAFTKAVADVAVPCCSYAAVKAL